MNITAYILTLSIILGVLQPVHAGATGDPPRLTYPSAVIISEIQTGAGSAGDEFVELSNVSEAPVDITGWHVRYLNASSTGNSLLLAALGSEAGRVVLPPGGHYVLHTADIELPADVMGQVYAAKLSSSDKVIGLFAPNPQTCLLEVQDAIAWGASGLGEGDPLLSEEPGDKLLQRRLTADGLYVDTNTNGHDIAIAKITKDPLQTELALGSTMGSKGGQQLPAEASPLPTGPGSTLPAIQVEGCSPPDAPGEEIDNGLETPDEEPPSTVGGPPVEHDESGPTMPPANVGLKAPQLTELLANPGKPRTDANDEFVELYNSNQGQFDLSGFMLIAGAGTTKKKYTFPQGSILPGRSFKAYFSADTRLALSNTKGQVGLLDPFGNAISTTDVYESAKDDQSWALAKGSWQWTTQPTPGAANHIVAPVSKAAAKKSSATTRSPSGLSAGGNVASVSSTNNPGGNSGVGLHTGVLALVAVIALLYGAYEYRSDVANKLRQFRLYREARREARQGAKRR